MRHDGTVKSEQKISSLQGGGLMTTLTSGNTRFGYSVAGLGDLDGDEVLDIAVGANRDGDGGGAVYILLMMVSGMIKSEQKISSTQGGGLMEFHNNDRFGWSLAGIGDLDGDGVVDLVVGAAHGGDDDATEARRRGAVYVLLLNADGSMKANKMISASSEGGELWGELRDGDVFGSSVAAVKRGDIGVLELFVGAPGDDIGGRGTGGAVHLLKVPSGFIARCDADSRTKCVAESNGGGFQCETDFDNCQLNNGGCQQRCFSNYHGVSCGCDPGYVLDNSRTGCSELIDVDTYCNPGVLVPGGVAISHTRGGPVLEDNDYFGISVAAIGDMDGDGVRDLVVGAPGRDDGGNNSGAVYLLFMDGSGHVKGEKKISSAHGRLMSMGYVENGDLFGSSVAGVDDLDGDGVGDLIVGAPGSERSFKSDVGAVYVLLMRAGGTIKHIVKIGVIQGGFNVQLAPGDKFGSAVAVIGDLDGDGVCDLIVGAPGSDKFSAVDSGAVYVLFMHSHGVVKNMVRIASHQGGFNIELGTGTQFGSSVVGIGDLNGDGVPGMVVGAPGDADGGENQGALYVLFMLATGTVKTEQKISAYWGGLNVPLRNNDMFGYSVGVLGDLDRDGVVDLIVSAPHRHHDGGGYQGGSVFVLLMKTTGTIKREQELSSSNAAVLDLMGGEPIEYFGQSLAGLGDLNGDGVTDVAVGAHSDDGGAGRGALFVLKVPSGFVALCGSLDCFRGNSGGHTNYTCGCEDDSTVDPGSGSCTSVIDECSEGLHDCGGSDICYDLPRSFYCSSPEAICGGVLFSEHKIATDSSGLQGPIMSGSGLAQSVASVGDIDGDGIMDLAVGAMMDDTSRGYHSGSVLILFMNSDRTVRAQGMVLSNYFDHGWFGWLVAGLGDLDGDGVGDLAASLKGSSNNEGGPARGGVTIVFLTTKGEAKKYQRISSTEGGLQSLVDGALFGLNGIAGLGDLDGDGVVDMAVGSLKGDDSAGMVHILFLNSDGTVKSEKQLRGRSRQGEFGDVTAVGDLDGDGVGDIGVGAHGEN